MKTQNSKFNTQNLELRTIFLFIHLLRIPHFSFLISLFFFMGCATKTEPIFVTLKSPKIKISDEGFLKKGINYKELVIYKAGNLPLKFLIKDNEICFNNKCINKYYFIKKYFNESNKNIFDTILDKKPFKDIKIIKTKDGFIQKSNFFYKVTKNTVLFKDKNLIVFVKYLKEKND